jgi:DNA-binding NarL/FixJ family response regulator
LSLFFCACQRSSKLSAIWERLPLQQENDEGGDSRLIGSFAENLSQPELSARELDILKLVAEGKSNKEIGSTLGITEGTVKTHVKNLLHKLHVPGRTAAIREAVRRGFVHMK